MNVGIAILLPKKVTDFAIKKARYLSSKYDTYEALKQKPPHITVKWPFRIENIKLIEKYCKELAKIKSFNVEYSGYGFFEPKVIFMKVKFSKRLVNLHLKILKDLRQKFGVKKKSFEGRKQQFHTTIAYGDISMINFYKAKEEIIAWKKPKFSFTYRSIGLFKRQKGEWILHKEYKC